MGVVDHQTPHSQCKEKSQYLPGIKIKGKGLHNSSEEGKFLERELSKKYLTGTLSSKEKYQIEDRLLENDFAFEAMEGLEQVPWERCEHQLLETEQRIIREFSLSRPSFNRKVALTLVGLIASALLATWYFATGPDTVDMSSPQLSTASDDTKVPSKPLPKKEEPKDKNETNPPKPDTVSAALVSKPDPQETSTAKVAKPEVSRKQVENREDEEVHIAVGRVIDIKGIAIVNATVKSGDVSDTTDNYGYFALKVPMGGTRIVVSHLATDYPVEIDTNQNWEIVLDIAQQKVHDYAPMNAANRFK